MYGDEKIVEPLVGEVVALECTFIFALVVEYAMAEMVDSFFVYFGNFFLFNESVCEMVDCD